MLKFFSRIFSSKIIFFLATTAIILSLNLTPLVLQFRHAPEGRTFALIHNNTQDFFFYQALMNEGAQGAWLTSDPFTSEPHQSSIIFSYFLWLGKISKILGLSYALTYHLIRLTLGIFLLSVVCYLLFFIKIPHPRLAFLFFLFAAPFMHAINDGGKITSVPFMNWWTGMDPIRRVAYLPHHMFGGLFLVISIILIIKFVKETKLRYLIWLIVIAGLLAFVHTPSLLIILLILPPTLFLYLILIGNWNLIGHWKLSACRRGREIGNSQFIGLFVYWFIGLLFLFLMVSQTNRGFPWSQYIAWEKRLQFPLDRELIGALGILLPFSLIGIINALRSKRFDCILISCWFAIPLLLIPFAPMVGLSNIRLIQGVPYLPMAILAVLGLISSEGILKKFSNFNPPAGGQISNLFYCLIGLLFLIFTLPTLRWSLKDQIREYWPIFGNVYLDNRLNNAFTFINQNFPAKTITLSTFYTGNYLPAFTNTVSFIGHFGYTYNIESKQEKVKKFFENKMSLDEAKNFILNNKIKLIVQGPEEKPIYKDRLYPTILKPVYDREEITIYTSYFLK